jgi:hypothetical protein
METFTKISDNEIEITAEVKAPEVMVKEFSELQADLDQAIASREYVVSRHAEELKPIDETIALMTKRVAEATKQGVVAKVEVVEAPVEELPVEEVLIKG